MVGFMRRATGIACVYSALTFALIASGCQSTAIRPRPDVDRRGMERGPDAREPTREEIVGTVEQVDRTNNEIRLRTMEAKVIVIKYDSTTRVYSRERELGIDALRPRDLILIRASKTSRGEQYADLIRLNDRDEPASRRD
jgi:hypothetical protein